jgi:hypothetical protein
MPTGVGMQRLQHACARIVEVLNHESTDPGVSAQYFHSSSSATTYQLGCVAACAFYPSARGQNALATSSPLGRLQKPVREGL